MENANFYDRLLAGCIIALTAILAVGETIITVFFAVRKSIVTGFLVAIVTILLVSVTSISYAGRLTESEFACRSKQVWDEIQSASLAGQQAGVNKMQSFLATGQCFWTASSASCVIVDYSIWTEVGKVYINNNGPFYMQQPKDKGCAFR